MIKTDTCTCRLSYNHWKFESHSCRFLADHYYVSTQIGDSGFLFKHYKHDKWYSRPTNEPIHVLIADTATPTGIVKTTALIFLAKTSTTLSLHSKHSFKLILLDLNSCDLGLIKLIKEPDCVINWRRSSAWLIPRELTKTASSLQDLMIVWLNPHGWTRQWAFDLWQ